MRLECPAPTCGPPLGAEITGPQPREGGSVLDGVDDVSFVRHPELQLIDRAHFAFAPKLKLWYM